MAAQPQYGSLTKGSILLKISSSGKAVKRHVFVTDDLKRIKWIPSKKKHEEDFVELSQISTVQSGRVGPRLERFGPSSSSREAAQWLQVRQEHGPTETISGWLEKLGGANRGRVAWAKRWFVLHGTRLMYFASPSDAEPKGHFDLDGASFAASRVDGRGAFCIAWGRGDDEEGGQPTRKLKAETPAMADKWMGALKRAVQLAKAKGALDGKGGRPPVLRGGDEGSAILPSSQPSDDHLCLSLFASGGAEDGKVISFMAGSPREFEALYGGLLTLLDEQQHATPAGKGGSPSGKAAGVSPSSAKREERLKRQLAERPGDAVIGALLGAAQEASGKLDAALASYKAAAASNPLSPSARGGYGRLLLSHKHSARAALPHLEAAVVLTAREDPEVLRAYAQALLEAGKTAPEGSGSPAGGKGKKGSAASGPDAPLTRESAAKAAVAALELTALLEAPSRVASTAFALGCGLAALGDHERAVAQLRAAAGLVGSLPSLPPGLLGTLGESLGALGKREEAATALSAAAAAAGDLANPGEARRIACARLGELGRWREAVAHAEAALADAPDSVESILGVAEAYFRVDEQRLGRKERGGGGIKVVPAPSGATGGAAPAAASGGGKGGRDPMLDDEDEEGAGEEEEPEDEDDEEGGGARRRKAGKGSRGSSGGGKAGAPPPAAATGGITLEPPPLGSLPVDKLSPLELCTASERQLVKALTLRPESPAANILCARVYERLAAIERDSEAAKLGPDSGNAPTGDEVADSGWTPNQRLAKSEEWYGYVALAYPDATFLDAPLCLARLLKRRGRFEEAATYFRLVGERTGGEHAEAAEQLARCERLAEGKPEVEEAVASESPSGKKKKKAAVEEEEGEGGGEEAGGDGDDASPSQRRSKKDAELEMGSIDAAALGLTAGMSQEERKKAYFKAMADQKKAKEDEEEARKAARIASMTPEEKEEWDKAQAEAAKHAAKKEKALTSGLGQYGKGGAANKLLAARGRGRGRGK